MPAPAADPLSLALFILAAVLLAGGAGVWLILAAGKAKAPDTGTELAVYRDQIAEVERDLAEGRLDARTAEAAMVEVGRRLAQAEARLKDAEPGRTGMSGPLVLLSAAFVILTAGGIFLWRGTLIPDQPFDARRDAIMQLPISELSQDELIVLLQDRAEAEPADARPHLLLGQLLVQQGRDAEALRAFQAALRRDPRNADALAEIGGLFLRASEDGTSQEAEEAFAAALAIDPNHLPTRFQQAQDQWQRGNQARAWEIWRQAWAAGVRQPQAQIDLAGRIIDVTSALDRGPDALTAEAMGAMSPEQQMATITGMIDQRRARLEANPDDLALRLSTLRVLAMSGRVDDGRAVLEQGLARSRNDAFAAALLATSGAMTGLGVPDAATGRLRPLAPQAPALDKR